MKVHNNSTELPSLEQLLAKGSAFVGKKPELFSLSSFSVSKVTANEREEENETAWKKGTRCKTQVYKELRFFQLRIV
jgi:hypothetical protein